MTACFCRRRAHCVNGTCFFSQRLSFCYRRLYYCSTVNDRAACHQGRSGDRRHSWSFSSPVHLLGIEISLLNSFHKALLPTRRPRHSPSRLTSGLARHVCCGTLSAQRLRKRHRTTRHVTQERLSSVPRHVSDERYFWHALTLLGNSFRPADRSRSKPMCCYRQW